MEEDSLLKFLGFNIIIRLIMLSIIKRLGIKFIKIKFNFKFFLIFII